MQRISQPHPLSGIEEERDMKSSRLRRARALITACVAGMATLALTSAPASARAHHGSAARNLPVVPGSRYLALGDSVTFGYEEPQVVPAPDYARAAASPATP